MSPNLIRHIGLIPDGGRRWASRQKVPLSASYELSVRKIATFSDRFFSDDITSISIYLASTLNLEKRGEDELISLFYALDYMFLDLLPEVCHKWHAQIGVAGLRTNLSYEASLESLCNKTKKYRNKHIYLVLNYNPIDELRQAKINSTKLEFWKSLWVPHGLDIIFRSGEAKTLSEFLPLQSAYANLVFFDNLFNDIPYVMFSKEVERIRSLHLRYGD